MSGKIERRRDLSGSSTSPEQIEELEERKALHRRLIQGKPSRSFDEHLREKMYGKPEDEAEEGEESPKRGAKDPHLGLSPGQSPDLASGGKGRRAGRVIVKG